MPVRELLKNSLTRNQIQEFLRVKPHHLYVLGRLDLQVNVYSQQVRAINLVHAIAESGDLEPTSRIAVVGGGAAGLTAAATAGWLGFRNVTLYERATEILSAFRHNTVRHLHPHMYDWPYPGWDRSKAGLPILDWEAGTPKEVAKTIQTSWERLRDVFGIKQRIFPNGNVTGIEFSSSPPHPLRLNLSNGNRDFDVVILALGFGPERNLRKGDPGYWSNDRYEETRQDSDQPTYLVSGCGDGGLIDYLRMWLQGFDQGKLISQLLPDGDKEVEAAKHALMQIEEELWHKHPPDARGKHREADQRWLFESYWEIETTGIRGRIENSRRAGTTTYLTSPEPSPLRPSAFILNRFLTLQVLRVDGLEPDPRTRLPRQDGASKYLVGRRRGYRDFTKVIYRHGPQSALQEFRGIPDGFSKTALDLGRHNDSTRIPAWKQGEDWQEASRRSALTQSVLGSNDLFELLTALVRFCGDNSGEYKVDFGEHDRFINSKLELVKLFSTLSDNPNLWERRRLIKQLSAHWTSFGRVLATARLAIISFQEKSLPSRLLMLLRDRFIQAKNHGHDALDIAPGSVVPVLPRTSALGVPSRSLEGPVPKLTSVGWLPLQQDYQVRVVWHADLPAVNSIDEVGVLFPNSDHNHLRFSRNQIGWTVQLIDPERQRSAVVSLLDPLNGRASPIKALVMPELSASPEVVEGLRNWLASQGASMILAAGSHHSLGAEDSADHESALLIASSSGIEKYAVYKSFPCHFKADLDEGIADRPLEITVHMSYSFSLVCILCADLKRARTWEILPILRPRLILVPACTAEPMDDIAYDLARSSGAIVAVAYAATPAPVTKRAAFVVGPAEDGPPVTASQYHPLVPQLFSDPKPGEESA